MVHRDSPRPRAAPPKHPRFAMWVRIVLFMVGWVLVLIGVAGLVLPGIQGIFTIVLGAAVLSLVSDAAYLLLRFAFARWPRGWRRIVKLRQRLRRGLSRFGSAGEEEVGKGEGSGDREGPEPPSAGASGP